jgi:hypothetical protein
MSIRINCVEIADEIDNLSLDQNEETLAGTKTLVTTDKVMQKLNPGGASRDVILSAITNDLMFIVHNSGTLAGFNLVVKNPAAATLAVLVPGMTGIFHCGATAWTKIDNKKVNTATVASSATPTPNMDITDEYTITALAEAATFGAPTGTLVNGRKLIIRIKDNGTARVLNWNAIYRAGTDVALPTTTVISKTMYCGFIYNSTDIKWDLVAYIDNI